MHLTAQQRKVLSALAALLVIVALWWVQQDSTAQTSGDDRARDTSQTSGSPRDGGTDPDSGLPFIDAGDLPAEAGETLRLIDDGGPYPYREDDGTFGNFEGILPDRDRGYYREYTVETPGLSHRGPLRIVTGSEGEFYWTDDHYSSFDRIVR